MDKCLHGLFFSWIGIIAGVPYGSILGSVPFLVYINHLADRQLSNVSFIVDNKSLFTIFILTILSTILTPLLTKSKASFRNFAKTGFNNQIQTFYESLGWKWFHYS